MEFVPFTPPPSDAHPIATGNSTENGTNAKNFVTGVNTYLAHLFSVIHGDIAQVVQSVDGEARAAVEEIAGHVAAVQAEFTGLQQRLASVEQQIALLTAHAPVFAKPADAPAQTQPLPGGAAPDPLADAIKQATGQ